MSSAEKRIELRVLEVALAFGKMCLAGGKFDGNLEIKLHDVARELAKQRNSLVTEDIIDKLDVGAAGPFPSPKLLMLEATVFGTKQRIVIDQHNNVTAERLAASPALGWARMSWLVDATPLIGYALRRAIFRGIDEAEVVETTDVVIIELGEIK